ncbi:40fa7f92-2fc6-4a09-bd21-52e966abac21 [Thermothielavioides terrestris]|uniref:40fa7f92-2fc6-4a09-bd21-52e966abac21 n=1 Tax=Thermothielavioides terrestris TaxID=2587410 RepID=A0A446BDV1_9PEZI|nr:40fa7f92-2fc6-4a09-bd21-52e966abac21 [Thermothielavioides terrestris]
MTRLSTIRAANAALKAERRSGVVAIFVGATSGIGLHTLETTVTLFDDPTIYVLGRSEAKFSVHRAKLEQLNPKAKIIFLQVDVSLVADVDSACDRIAAAETKVDYLYMSAGMIPLNGPQYTREGLDICFALSYYTRIRFVQKLKMVEDDLGLEDKKNYATRAAMTHTTTMMSLALEYLSQQHKDIVFLHAYPGLVRTDIFARLEAPPGSSLLRKLVVVFVSKGVTALMWLFGIPPEESGERQAWHLTSTVFEKGKLHQINQKSDEIAPGDLKVFEDYKQRGWPERVWEYTMRVLERAVASTSGS